MFLKSLDIYGFKSFADKTHIEFSRGIICVIGPNGAGKTNILDAIQWVIGEQSTNDMRVENMKDVIFGGTEKRKEQNFAEVALTFSNDDRTLPIDTSEVEIKRRLYLNGDSEYLINNNLMRLKDIRALFFNTGIGKSVYSVIPQNRVADILSAKPEERRIIFEEAAEISKYKNDEKEALSKLKAMDENLKSVNQDFEGLKKQYDRLKLQAANVLESRKISAQIKELDVKYSILNYISIQNLKNKTEYANDNYRTELEKLRKESEELEKNSIEIAKTIEKLTDEKTTFAKELGELIGSINGWGYAIQSLKTQIKSSNDNYLSLKERATNAKNEIEKLQKTKSQTQENKIKYEKLAAEIENPEEKFRTIIDSALTTINSQQDDSSKLAKVKELILSMSDLLDKLEHKVDIKENLSKATAELNMIETSLKTQSQIFDQNTADYEKLQQDIKNLTVELEEKEKTLTETNKKIKELKEKVNQNENKIIEIKRELDEKKREVNREKIQAVKENMVRNDMQIESYSAQLKSLSVTFYEKWGENLKKKSEELVEKDEVNTQTPAEIKTEIESLQSKLKSLGNLNYLAEEEFKDVKVRYDLVSSQVKDILEAREDLKRVRDEINERSRVQFLEVFEKINTEYNKYYSSISGGGSASIKLEDENVLSCGIDISARPGGKSPKDIMMLSGGEQSMAVIALLLAIYKVKAPPFCVLDEVESALDGSNAKIFLDNVREFKDTTQFVLITHNANTVQGADTLIGVTQLEPGVSKVLTLSVEKVMKESELYDLS